MKNIVIYSWVEGFKKVSFKNGKLKLLKTRLSTPKPLRIYTFFICKLIVKQNHSQYYTYIKQFVSSLL